MKKIAVLLVLGVFLIVSCEKHQVTQKHQVTDVSWTTCNPETLKSSKLSGNVEIEFTNNGVQIKYYDFEVSCDFTTVNVTHTFVNGVLNIIQQGSPNQANCICYTDVSYTINGISQNEVNVIFINGVQVYCHNNNGSIDITNVQYIRRFGDYKEIQQPIISVISARSELDQYYETHVKCIYGSDDGQFKEATKIYSDDFFANNFLVIVLLEEGSGSIRHKVERIDRNGDIVINRLIPEYGTCDMAEWNIVIELNNDFKLIQYRVVLVDVHE